MSSDSGNGNNNTVRTVRLRGFVRTSTTPTRNGLARRQLEHAVCGRATFSRSTPVCACLAGVSSPARREGPRDATARRHVPLGVAWGGAVGDLQPSSVRPTARARRVQGAARPHLALAAEGEVPRRLIDSDGATGFCALPEFYSNNHGFVRGRRCPFTGPTPHALIQIDRWLRDQEISPSWLGRAAPEPYTNTPRHPRQQRAGALTVPAWALHGRNHHWAAIRKRRPAAAGDWTESYGRLPAPGGFAREKKML